jgi:hypothetical protein
VGDYRLPSFLEKDESVYLDDSFLNRDENAYHVDKRLLQHFTFYRLHQEEMDL